MAYRNQKSIQLYLSTAPQPTINTPIEVAGSLFKFKTQPFDTPTPVPTMMSDQGEVGDGVGYTQNVWVYRWDSIGMSLNGMINDVLFPKLFARVLGGTPVDTTVTAATSYDHTIPMATELELVQPKLSTLITVGAAQFIWADVFIKDMTITQQGDDIPKWTASLGNTGLYKAVSASGVVLGSVTALDPNYFAARYHGAATTFTYNDGAAQDLTTGRGLASVTVKLTQPTDVINLPGDSFITAGDSTTGSYSATLMRKTQDQDIIQIRVYADTPLAQWAKLVSSTVLTNVIVKFKGMKIGASTDNFETEIKLTRAQFTIHQAATQGEYEAFDITIKALPDTTTKRLAVCRIRDGVAAIS